MAILTIKVLGFAPTGLIDARALGFRTFLDGEYLQYFIAAVSGLEQVTVLNVMDDDDEALMWRAVAMTAAAQIRAAVEEGARSGTIPKADPTEGIPLRIDVALVRDRMRSVDSLPPSIDEGSLIASFEV